MYWNIGEYVSRRVSEGGWGKSIVKEFSNYIQSRYVGIKGFSASNIWRMKQFYETYFANEKLATLSRESTSYQAIVASDANSRMFNFLLHLSIPVHSVV